MKRYTILKIKYCYSNGKPLFVGSPAMAKKDGLFVPNYVTSIHNAACFNDEEREQALKELPLIRGAFEFITDIEEYQEREYFKNLNEPSMKHLLFYISIIVIIVIAYLDYKGLKREKKYFKY